MPANTPIEVHHLFIKYIREGDIESALTLYDPHAVFANRDSEVRTGHAAIRDELGPLAAAKQVFEFNAKKIIEAGDIALIHNQWEMVSPHKESGYAIEVLRRQPDGSWRFLIGDPFTIRANGG